MKLTTVLYVLTLDRKLVSISALTARGVAMKFLGDHATFSVNDTVVATVPRSGKLFSWTVASKSSGEEAHQVDDKRTESWDL